MILERRTKNYLAEIESKSLTRKLAPPNGIDLSSNDYLCLAKDERLQFAMIKGIKREGIGSTASRLLRGERKCFADVEKQFASWKKTERSLYFATGYQANVGILQTFIEENDIVYSDELNHASLIDGLCLAKCRKVIFKHRNVCELEKLLRRETNGKGQKFLITESLFSMDGTIAPLEKYAEICRETKTNLIVDEAHAVGIYGKKGSGLIEEVGIEKDVFLSINTAGKALGASGAFIAGDDWAIEYLINKCRSFIFSTAPLPAVADALKVAIEIIKNEPERREKLFELSQFLCDLLVENNIDAASAETQIVPIMIGESEKASRIAKSLQSRGFDVRAIRPPTVAEGTSRLRLSLNIGLKKQILQDFVNALKTYL